MAKKYIARNTRGEEISQRSLNKTYHSNSGIAKLSTAPRGGETHRERQRVEVRDAFMEQEGIDRPTFERKYGVGAGYKEWRKFAETMGLHLPA